MRIGILGGGQLARMLILAGVPMGMEFVIYSPELSPCTQHIAECIIGDYQDFKRLDAFLERVDVVTYENENIPVACVRYIEQKKKVYPDSRVLEHTQDRLYEKRLFKDLDIHTNRFYPVETFQDLYSIAEKLTYPFIIKSRRSGYDGKNQYRISCEQDLRKIKKIIEQDAFIAEEYIAFDREISMIAVRNTEKASVFYDVCENRHQGGILIKTQNQAKDPLFDAARQAAEKILKHFDYIGVLSIEFFVKNNCLIANEIAPRVHNSGHWTLEGSFTSQFANHLRAVAGLPLGETRSRIQCVMYNVIGAWPDKRALYSISSVSIHDYQKNARPGRKLGHVTLQRQNQKNSESMRWLDSLFKIPIKAM